MTRFVERLSLMASFSVLSVAVLTGAKSAGRALADARIEQLTTRLDAVERRLAAAERATATSAALGTTVKAPFVVIDAGGRPILTVRANPRGFTIQDPAGKVVVAASALQGGGFVKALTADESRVAVLGAVGDSAMLALRDGDVSNRLTLTVAAGGKPVLRLLDGSHQTVLVASALPGGGFVKALTPDESRVAVLGISDGSAILALRDGPQENRVSLTVAQDGTPGLTLLDAGHQPVLIASALPGGGFLRAQTSKQDRVAILGTETGNALVTLRDGPSTPRATLAVTANGESALVLMNKAHINVLTLTQGEADAGMIQLSNASGKPTVEAGTLLSGVGIVRTGPKFKCTGNAGLIANDCIKGHP